MVSIYDKVILLIYNAIVELNQQLLPEQKVDPSLETVLIGDRAQFDSMALITLIVIIGGKIEEEFGVEIILVGENSVLEESIFTNVSTLAHYIASNIDKENGL